MLGGECDLKMHARNMGYPMTLINRGPQNTFFRWLRNLINCNFNDMFAMKYDTYNRQVHWKLQEVSYIVSKCHRPKLRPTNGLKLDPSFYPPSVNSAFYFIARPRRRTSANGIQPNFAKRWTINRANNLLKKSRRCPS